MNSENLNDLNIEKLKLKTQGQKTQDRDKIIIITMHQNLLKQVFLFVPKAKDLG